VPTPFQAGDVVRIGDAALVVQAVPVSATPRPLSDAPLVSPLDVELARSARSRSPFAVVQVIAPGSRPSDVLPIVRGTMRITDVIKGDGQGGFQLLLVETAPEQATQAIDRLVHALDSRGISAKLGLARYPEEPGAPPTAIV